MNSQPAYADLSPLARLVIFLDSLPDPEEATQETADAPAVKRTDLRDRIGRIITLDRAGTSRSIAAQTI